MKSTIISIVVALSLVGGVLFLTRSSDGGAVSNVNNVTVVDGKQIIEIKAKGGYLPRKSIAKAGLPTILRFDTNGTFDCLSSVRVPSLKIVKTLPQTGVTDIDIGVGQLGTLQGMCGMGMYPFEVEFQN